MFASLYSGGIPC